MQPSTGIDRAAPSPVARRESTRERQAPTPWSPPSTTLPTTPEESNSDAPSPIGSILEHHPAGAPITITHERSVTGSMAHALWEAYRTNFEPLASLAILQHFYSHDQMIDEFANPRILKIVGWHEGAPVGLAMVTNSLEDVPQISPQFLRARYPEHATRDSIYFGILVMVAPGLRGRTLFSRLYTELWQVPALAGGVLVFDICEFNRQLFDTDALTQRIASSFPRSAVQILDQQTWYVAELPEPIPNHPSHLSSR